MANGTGSCIKLKVSKTEAIEEMKTAEEQHSPRICTVCNKGFASGKALGGHMRMHFQAQKKNVTRNISRLKKVKYVPNVSSQLPTCYSCGKNFPSMKSLFGHMRSHPERTWRGIQPWKSHIVKNNSSSAVSDALPQKFDDRTDSAATTVTRSTVMSGSFSAGWPVTAKRGCKGTPSNGGSGSDTGFSAGESAEEQRMHEAVSDLMLLAQECELEAKKSEIGGSQPELDHSPSIVDCASNFPSENCTKIDVATLETDASAKPPAKRMRELGDAIKRKKTDNEVDGKMQTKNKKKKKRKMKSIHSEIATNQSHEQNSPVSSYKCNLCGKKFPNHQALGGHRSSHNKAKKMKIITDASPLLAAADNAAQTSMADLETEITIPPQEGGSTVAAAARCGDGPAETESSTQMMTSPRQVGQISSSRTLNIDLNELPAMDDEEYAEWDLLLS